MSQRNELFWTQPQCDFTVFNRVFKDRRTVEWKREILISLAVRCPIKQRRLVDFLFLVMYWRWINRSLRGAARVNQWSLRVFALSRFSRYLKWIWWTAQILVHSSEGQLCCPAVLSWPRDIPRLALLTDSLLTGRLFEPLISRVYFLTTFPLKDSLQTKTFSFLCLKNVNESEEL